MKKNSVILLLLTVLSGQLVGKELPPCTSPDPIINSENSELYASVIAADNAYANTYTAQPDMFAKDKAVVLTCMDPRIILDDIMGFGIGDMYVLRNAGGLATEDSLRSLIIAYKLLAANQIFVIQHTDCGMQKFTQEIMTDLLKESIVTATLEHPCEVTTYPVKCDWKNVCKCSGQKDCKEYGCIKWLAIRDNLYDSVVKAVKKIRKHPLIPSDVPIYGLIFDVITGELTPVERAMEIGRAKPLKCKK